MKHKLESRLPGEISIISDTQITPLLRQTAKRNREPLDESERGEWKSWLKIQKTKIMASSPIPSWQTDGETMETVTDFIFLGSKITANGACSHEIKRCLFLERKIMTNLESILKSRGPSGQSYGFPNNHVWMWELDHKESWTPKNWCFWTVVLEKTLESPFDCQEIQPVPLKEN